jgi:phage terminase large subunit-like protein
MKLTDPVTDYAKNVLSGRIIAGPHVRNACRRHLADLDSGPDRGLFWDLEAAHHAMGFFPAVLRLSSAQFEGRPFVLQPSQEFKIGSVFGWKRADGSRRFRRAYIEEAKGSGKALALDTPIPTPTGWTMMGQIKVGDQVFDETGAICNVVGAFHVMHGHPCYRVAFSDGTSIVADAEHLWVTATQWRDGPTEVSRRAIRTTSQIAASLKIENHRIDGPSLLIRTIVACDTVESVPVRCIAVDSPSHLFLAGEGMVPTHNTPEAAGVGIYCLIADGEQRAEVYAAASTKIQANILFRDANAMREQSPRLRTRLRPTGVHPVVNLYDTETHSFFRPIASENVGQSGPRPSCALCDELHEHRDGVVVDMLERGFKWRRQPLLWMTTNAGTDRNSMCWEEHGHAVAVAAGDKEDDTTFAYVCGLDEGDDPLTDPSCWVKGNPLLGVTVTSDYLAEVSAQARSIPGKTNNILRLHFCVWTDAERAWLPRATLEKCVVDFDPRENAGRDVWAGLDLSSSQDITALAFAAKTGDVEVERVNPDGSRTSLVAPTFDLWAEGWTPGDTLDERAIRDSAPYEVWAREGWLNAPPGRLIRFDYPAARLAEVSSIYRIRRLAYDRYAFNRFEDELDQLGLKLPVIEHPQGGKRRASLPEEEIRELKFTRSPIPRGLWMPGSVAALESLLLENRIRVQNSPALISAFMSAIFEEDPFGNRWFSKRRATNRIDLLVASAMAIGAADAMLVTSKVDISTLVA